MFFVIGGLALRGQKFSFFYIFEMFFVIGGLALRGQKSKKSRFLTFKWKTYLPQNRIIILATNYEKMKNHEKIKNNNRKQKKVIIMITFLHLFCHLLFFGNFFKTASESIIWEKTKKGSLFLKWTKNNKWPNKWPNNYQKRYYYYLFRLLKKEKI